MKSIRLKHLILLALLPALFIIAGCSCKRTLEKDEIFGNRLVSAPEGFTGIVGPVAPRRIYRILPPNDPAQNQAFDPNSPSPDFLFGRFDDVIPNVYRGDLIYFNNILSHEVTWFIKLKGLTSNAEKTYTATSNSIDSSYAYIDGSADGTRFFIPGEKITYTISFLGSSITYSGTLVTLVNVAESAKRYHGLRQPRVGADALKYHLVDDMEPSGFTKLQGLRVSYRDAADYNNAMFYLIADKAVDGRFAYYMKATDINRNTYCGGFGGETLTELYEATTETDPSKVYVNAYVYGYGRPNSTISMLLFEDDFWSPGDPVPSVRPDATKNDMWFSIVQVDWVGWKLVSVPYASFRSANNPNSGGSGNRIREPHKLAGMGMELNSYPVAGNTVELALDAVYLTTNGAFQP